MNPHTDIRGTGACRIEIHTVEVWNQGRGQQYKQQERACVYGPDGRCMATCTPSKLVTLRALFHRAKEAGLHSALSPEPLILEQEVMDLRLRYRPGVRPHGQDTTSDTKSMWSSHPTLVAAMRTHLGINADRFASPLDVQGHDLRFWSKHSRDAAFEAHADAYSCTWQGYSYAFAGSDTTCIEKATKWAL